jgi:hypothetical protein
MTITTVSTTGEFAAAIKVAKSGDTIALTAGTYTPLTLSNLNFSAGITITSVDPNQAAVMTGISATNCTGLNFTHLTFSTASTPLGPWGAPETFSFIFTKNNNLGLSNLSVEGVPNSTLSQATSGIKVVSSRSVTIHNNTFNWLHYGIEQVNNNGVSIYKNSFSYLYDDAVRGGGSNNVNISYNNATNMHMDRTDLDHPDFIQVWTTTAKTSNIKIIGNVYTRGTEGNPIQGVFIQDAIGGLTMSNVTVSNNTIIGGMYNGISINGVGPVAQNVTVSGNVVQAYSDQRSWINVFNVTNGTVSNNKSSLIQYNTADVNVTSSNNTSVSALPVPTVQALSVSKTLSTNVSAGDLQLSTIQFVQAAAAMDSPTSSNVSLQAPLGTQTFMPMVAQT